MVTAILLVSSLWLHADFDHPLLVDGRIQDVRMVAGAETSGKFGKGYAFVSEKERCENDFIVLSDPDLLANFPWHEGSFSCFYRLPEGGSETKSSTSFFCYGGYWQYQWTWLGSSFSCEDSLKYYGKLDLGDNLKPSRTWRHFCATWNAEELACYYDGVKVASKKNPTRVDMRNVSRANLRIGAAGDGRGAANLEADEISIYDRALSASEVAALSASSVPALGDDRILVGHIAFPIYWRNQRDAALRMKIWSPKAQTVAAELTVGGVVVHSGDLTLPSGESDLVVPFDPSRLAPGSYAYALIFKDAKEEALLDDAGTVEIRGRVEPDAFRMMSWGGSTSFAPSNLYASGLNSANMTAGTVSRGAREYLRHDVFLNWRLENSKAWQTLGFDEEAIAASARETLAVGEGLHLWQSTLVNSEVYNANVSALTNNALLYARAVKALGRVPDTNTRREPEELSYKAKSIPAYQGAMPADDPTLRTIEWYWFEGFPVYAVNRANARAIHALSPDNLVWSEPSTSPVGLDMVSDWLYDYKTETTLQTMRRHYALARAKGVLNQPTLAMGYWHTFPPSGRHPATGEEVRLAQSCDEVMIKSWMALGAVRTDHLSFFSADTWQLGAEGYAAWQADPVSSNVVSTIGETDAIARYGQFVRTRFRPAAELLRGIDNVRAKVALVWLEETDRAGSWQWSRYHYRNQVGDALARQPWAFDYLTDNEMKREILSGYDYLVLPMLNVITDEHDALLRALPETVRFVTDSHAKVDYPTATKLADMRYRTGTGVLEFNTAGVDVPLGGFFADKTEALHRSQAGWSDEDGTNAYTFVKALKGVTYVTVVNNARRDGGSPMNAFKTDAWYRPCGAPQTITTHFNVPEGGCVYEFNRENCSIVRLEDCSIALDYAAAEARVFCIYPRELTGMTVSVREPAAGEAGTVATVCVSDAAGAAPGRQVVEVTVRRGDGSLTDESGLYRVEDGCCTVPIRFTEGERASAAGWTVSVRELTSGLTASATMDPSRRRTWTGAASPDWADPANWSGESVPADGDTVVIGGAGTVELAAATPRLAALELGAGATLTAAGWETRIAAGAVVVRNGATLTCPPCDSQNGVTTRVWIVCGDLTVEAGGTIDVKGKGFECAPKTGQNAGRGPGGGKVGGGGSHGGFGGWSWINNNSKGYNALPNDSAEDPQLPGSSGSTSAYGNDGVGGGVVRIEATGVVRIDGTVSADAPSHTGTGNNAAGAGGTVNVRCARIEGTGRISADGGCSYNCGGNSTYGGPGGGGRIAIRYDPSVQTSGAAANLTISAAPGRPGKDTGTKFTAVADQDRYYTIGSTRAGAGTLWFTDTKLLAGLGSKLTGVIAHAPDALTLGTLDLTAGQVMFPNEGFTLNVEGDLTVSSDAACLELGGVYPTNRVGSVTYFCGGKPTRLNVHGDLKVLNGGRLDVRAAMTNGVEAFGAYVTVGGTLRIGEKAKVCPDCDPCNLGAVKFDVRSLVVDAGGTLCADYRGGAGGHTAANVSSLITNNEFGYGPGFGVSPYNLVYNGANNYYCGGGGGYGGRGMYADEKRTWAADKWSYYKGGRSYGDAFWPLLPGSGGGCRGNGWERAAGNGGGLVYVTATESIVVDGTVSANGMAAFTSQCGGGSGGAICLVAPRFTAGATAVLSANGGAARNSRSSGAGGGGRIAVWTGEVGETSRKLRTIRREGGPDEAFTFCRVAEGATVSAAAGAVTFAFEDDWPYATAAEDGSVWFTERFRSGFSLLIR